MKVEFTVLGEPVGKARPRVVHNKKSGRSVAYTPVKTKNYENRVKSAYLSRYKQQGVFSCDEPLKVSVNTFFTPPTSVTKRKRQQMLDGQIVPIKKPDCDNVAKAVLDALNGVAFSDDSRVVQLSVTKAYATVGRVDVCIESALSETST